jgi:hypothetical protein
METLRTKFIDYDARRKSKTDYYYCVCCQKDLKPGAKVRWVHCINGGLFALHPEDEKRYVYEPASDMGCFPLGMDCARKLGLEWTFSDDCEECKP